MSDLASLWWGAITLQGSAFHDVVGTDARHADAFVVLVVAGISLLVGQSVVLFLNMVRPLRFVLSMVLLLAVVVVEVFAWSLSLWGAASLLEGSAVDLRDAVAMVALAYAPFVLGFLLLIPYYGPPIERILGIWALAALASGVLAVTSWSFAEVLVVVTIGYLFRQLIKVTLGRWVSGLDRWLWRTATGRRVRIRMDDAFSTFRDRAVSDSRRWFGS